MAANACDRDGTFISREVVALNYNDIHGSMLYHHAYRYIDTSCDSIFQFGPHKLLSFNVY